MKMTSVGLFWLNLINHPHDFTVDDEDEVVKAFFLTD